MHSRREAIKSVAVGTAALAATPQAHAATKELAVLGNRWEKAKVFTLAVADAMPAESYAFKPTPEMRPFGELMAHLASANSFYISRFKGGEIPDSLRPPKEFDKDTVKKYLTASFDFCADAIKGLNEEALDKSYPGRPNTPAQTGWDWVMNAFIHTSHHRGYSEVYMRMKGITPPTYSV